MRVDPVRVQVTEMWRAGGFFTTRWLWTRDDVNHAGVRRAGDGFPLVNLNDDLRELARVGYLREGKRGSRLVYSRGEDERYACPDLPDGRTYARGSGADVWLVSPVWGPYGGGGPALVRAGDRVPASAVRTRPGHVQGAAGRILGSGHTRRPAVPARRADAREVVRSRY